MPIIQQRADHPSPHQSLEWVLRYIQSDSKDVPPEKPLPRHFRHLHVHLYLSRSSQWFGQDQFSPVSASLPHLQATLTFASCDGEALPISWRPWCRHGEQDSRNRQLGLYANVVKGDRVGGFQACGTAHVAWRPFTLTAETGGDRVRGLSRYKMEEHRSQTFIR